MIDRRFAADPALQAHLLLLAADRYEESNDQESSRRLIERAFAQSRSTLLRCPK